MELCAQVHPFGDDVEETLEYFGRLDIDSVDIKLDPATYLDDKEAQADVLALLEEHDLTIAVLGAGGGNPLHPVEERAREQDDLLRDTIRLASQLGVDTVTTFSGLPGGSPEDVTPNWITTPVPPRGQGDSYAYQWEEVAIPYWRDLGEFADDHEVDVAIELHVRTLVDGPLEMVRLREATHERIGGYVDPAHMTIQGIDPSTAIRRLAEVGANFHFEASDVKRYEANYALKGVHDMSTMREPLERSWAFCTVGYGHDEDYWRDIIGTLNLVGYDGAVSIQQLHTPEPQRVGFERAVDFLNGMLL